MSNTWIFLLLTFLVTAQKASASSIGLDTYIDKAVEPLSNFISNIVFYPVPIFGSEIPATILWILIAGIIFTIYFNFVSIWGFKHAFDVLFKKPSKDEKKEESGEVSSFEALATALSGTVGIGNIAGVAVAISIGGPGAMFWMVLCALFSMATKFVECSLSVKFRRFNQDGSVSGGPMHYIAHGLTRKKLRWLGQPLAMIFAIFCVAGSIASGNMLQINQATNQIVIITGGTSSIFYHNSWLVGVIIALVVAMIILGGIKSIGKVTSKLVPMMCILYIVAALYIIFTHLGHLPEAFKIIFVEAFRPHSVQGGIIGTIIIGFRRSVQSNEAGVGSAPIAYAAARTNEPLSQGFISLLEPFFDTVILCSITALVIVITGAYTNYSTGITGVALTSSAFESKIAIFPYILAIVIILFALSTLISWSYYGQKAWNYIFGEGKKRTRAFQVIYCLFVVIGSSISIKSVIDLTDATMLAMSIPNIIAMYILMPDLRRDLVQYCKKHNFGWLKK